MNVVGRPIPRHIEVPDYAVRGKSSHTRRAPGERKTPGQIKRMRLACRSAREILEMLGTMVLPGITTNELDAVCHNECIARGGYPSPLNYQGYPKSLCTSINEVICHGIPDDRPLNEGDIVNLDVTIFLHGVHGDCSATYCVGQVDPESRRLVEATRGCLWAGIGAVKPGRPINDVGRAIEDHATQHGYGVVRAFVGHGIGEQFHMEPQVPHYYEPQATSPMLPGMTFTIEPMITQGTWEHVLLDDGWTAVTKDGKRTAQFEHTVLVTDIGVEILTLLPEESVPVG